jgi:predicted SnoaL-like aldol condensation-catalyzing enzyme
MDRRTLITAVSAASGVLAAGDLAAAQSMTLPQRMAAALSAHDMVAFAALISDGYVNHQVSAAALPPPGAPVKTPKAATVEFFAARLAGMPDLKVTVEVEMGAGDKVAGSFVYSGTHGGTYFGIAPTGRPLRFTSCDIYRVVNGQLAEHWGMGDIAGILAQLRAPAS